MKFIPGIAVSAMLFAVTAVCADAPAPADVDYPGTLVLAVDATDLDHRVFRVHEEIPVAGGALTLFYPQWLPGNHSPRGPIDKLAGLAFSADGRPVAWSRDSTDVYAFRLDVPQGAKTLVADFEFLSPQDAGQGRVVMTPDMLDLQWNTVVLYPAGHAAHRIQVAPSVKLPAGWQFGTALESSGSTARAENVAFKPVSLDTLVDSPLYAGRHFKQVDLDPGAKVPVRMDIVADETKDLEITPEQLKAHRALIQQAYKLFGSQHYDHYDFLFSLSDQMSHIGLEHHRSSEDGTEPGYFSAWDRKSNVRDLLPHEFTHSWNGKFRRPADLATANFNVPMGDSLLWVYEGQTQYWGFVLAARSGLWTIDQARDALALVASRYADNRPGFSWRSVQDTTNDPVTAARRPLPYRNYQMSEDYYSAGQLIWLAVDAKLRAFTHERRSLDDFAHAFFGVDDGSWTVKTYTFDDVVAALNAIEPYDWRAFLRERLDAHAPPLDGFAASGWKLVYTDKPSSYQKSAESEGKFADHAASIGIAVSTKDGKITDVRWNGPAFKAGISPAGMLVAVQGREFSPERLQDAIAATANGAPIELLIKEGDLYRTYKIDYRGGLKYPHLERIDGAPDRLSAILAPRK
ncbi:MAG TPA: peptidase M61 [Rhodanobacteraceae bacterium]|jgi:predicted metalloprotease with PDZ domain